MDEELVKCPPLHDVSPVADESPLEGLASKKVNESGDCSQNITSVSSTTRESSPTLANSESINDFKHENVLSCENSHSGTKPMSSVDNDTAEIRVLLAQAVDTIVLREQDELNCGDTFIAATVPSASLDIQCSDIDNCDQLCEKNTQAICTYGDNEDDEFGDFSDPPELKDQCPRFSSEITNWPETVTVQTTGQIDENDDFGDFDQATFNEESSGGFANFENVLSAEEVRPISVTTFGETINRLFSAENSLQLEGSGSSDNSMTDPEYAEFTANIQRDIAHCENVDEWPCVVFRYENSVTRKALLNALCIDETPLNFPRFAIDCLSKAFLQPVKQTKGTNESHHCSESNSRAAGEAAGGQADLSDAAKDVLNKIPDLSFMKAEVLTFPAVSQAPLGIDLQESYRNNGLQQFNRGSMKNVINIHRVLHSNL